MAQPSTPKAPKPPRPPEHNPLAYDPSKQGINDFSHLTKPTDAPVTGPIDFDVDGENIPDPVAVHTFDVGEAPAADPADVPFAPETVGAGEAEAPYHFSAILPNGQTVLCEFDSAQPFMVALSQIHRMRARNESGLIVERELVLMLPPHTAVMIPRKMFVPNTDMTDIPTMIRGVDKQRA